MLFLNIILFITISASGYKLKASPRVINGTLAVPGQFPSAVALLGKGNILACTGNLISEWLILTAAHCIGHFVSVLAGDTKINGTADSRQVRNVAQIVKHPCYEESPNTYDLALIFIDPPFVSSEFVKPIDLCEKTPETGEVCTNAGWGNINEKIKPKPSNDLMFHRLKILGFKDCGLKIIFDGLVCAASSDSRPCHGDSGGPLICEGKLCGVTSARMTFGRSYNLFGNVHKSKEWILSNGTKGDSPPSIHNRKKFMFEVALPNFIILMRKCREYY